MLARSINLNGKIYNIEIYIVEEDEKNGNPKELAGRCREELGAMSQAKSVDELLVNMADAISLMEGKIGREPKGFWITKTVDEIEEYPKNSWQNCVQMLESRGYRLALETEKHKKFRSGSSAGVVSGGGGLGMGFGGGGGGGGSGGADFSTVSSLTVPVQDNINSNLLEFYLKLTGYTYEDDKDEGEKEDGGRVKDERSDKRRGRFGGFFSLKSRTRG